MLKHQPHVDVINITENSVTALLRSLWRKWEENSWKRFLCWCCLSLESLLFLSILFLFSDHIILWMEAGENLGQLWWSVVCFHLHLLSGLICTEPLGSSSSWIESCRSCRPPATECCSSARWPRSWQSWRTTSATATFSTCASMVSSHTLGTSFPGGGRRPWVSKVLCANHCLKTWAC